MNIKPKTLHKKQKTQNLEHKPQTDYIMKFILAIILTALLSFAVGLFTWLPWYSFVFCALIVAMVIHQKPYKAFITGFLALFLLWCILAILKDMPNEHILSTKVANILPLKGNTTLLIGITGLVGGLLAGVSAVTGSYARKK